MSGHQWASYTARKHRYIGGFTICHKCGLVWLKNKVSLKAARRACSWGEEEA